MERNDMPKKKDLVDLGGMKIARITKKWAVCICECYCAQSEVYKHMVYV